MGPYSSRHLSETNLSNVRSSDVSRNSEISLQCYLRTEEPKRGVDGIADDMGNDIFMGGVRFTPDFDDMGAPQEQWYELSGGSGQGKVMVALAYQPSAVSRVFSSFTLLDILHTNWTFEFTNTESSSHDRASLYI